MTVSLRLPTKTDALSPQEWSLIYATMALNKCWGAGVSGGVTILAPGLLPHQEEEPEDRKQWVTTSSSPEHHRLGRPE